ncbi:hypothetical protein N9W34_05925, partial [Rickettsiales bacterium]|nr:hypothetical protein [Rickettsiales bacterium]
SKLSSHPKFEYIQTKINELKERIGLKRNEAIEIFNEIIKALQNDISTSPTKGLKEQLEEIKNFLSTNSDGQKQTEIDSIKSELTIDDILGAIQSFTTTNDKKIRIQSFIVEEELKKIIAAKLMSDVQNLDSSWKNQVHADDIISVINSKFSDIAADFGGADKLVGQSIHFAESFSNIFDRMSDTISSPAYNPDKSKNLDEKNR